MSSSTLERIKPKENARPVESPDPSSFPAMCEVLPGEGVLVSNQHGHFTVFADQQEDGTLVVCFGNETMMAEVRLDNGKWHIRMRPLQSNRSLATVKILEESAWVRLVHPTDDLDG